MDARARSRIAVEPVPVRFLVDGCEGTGGIESVSRAGLFVRSAERPRSGAPIAIQFQPPVGRAITLRGEVRWSDADPAGGFGVMLHEPPSEYRAFYRWAAEAAQKPNGDPDDG